MQEAMLLLLVLGLLAALATGYPVAFALAGTALIFAGLGIATGSFDAAFLQAFPAALRLPPIPPIRAFGAPAPQDPFSWAAVRAH